MKMIATLALIPHLRFDLHPVVIRSMSVEVKTDLFPLIHHHIIMLSLTHRVKDAPEFIILLLVVNALIHKVQSAIKRMVAFNVGKHGLHLLLL